MGRTEISFQV